jgi:hypothetical protein
MELSRAFRTFHTAYLTPIKTRARKIAKQSLWIISFRNPWVRKARTLVTASGIVLGVINTIH